VKAFKINRRKWIVRSGVIAAIVVFIAIGPVMIAKYAKMSKEPFRSDIMVRVVGTIHYQSENNIVYLKSAKGFYYILLGDHVPKLLNNVNESVTVFGNVVVPNSVIEARDTAEIKGNPVRMRIKVVSFSLHPEETLTKATGENTSS
jgi:hypothetical protein